MVIAASVDVPSRLLGRPGGELTLRFCGATGEELRLRSNKCTVGSGPRCTLRLAAARVEPLHCVILRGATRTVIRNLSASTRLNGRAFDDATLAVGDRLSFGPWEFEVRDLGYDGATAVDPDANYSVASGATADDTVANALLEELAHEREGLARRHAELQRLADDLTEREQQLQDEIARWQQQIDQLEADRRDLDARNAAEPQPQVEDVSEALAAARRQWAEAEAAFDRERAQWVVERTQWELQQARNAEAGFDDAPRAIAEVAALDPAAVAQLTEESARLADARETLRQGFAAGAAYFQHLQQFVARRPQPTLDPETAYDARREQLERQAETLVEQVRVVEEERRRVAAERQQTIDQARAEQDALAERSRELAEDRERLLEDQADLARREAELARRLHELESHAATPAGAPSESVGASDQIATPTATSDDVERQLAALAREKQELEDTRLALDSQRASLAAELQAADDSKRQSRSLMEREQRELTEREQELAAREAELEAQQSQAQAQHEEWLAKHEQLEIQKLQVLQQAALLQQRQTELDADAQAMQAQRAELEAFMRQSHLAPRDAVTSYQEAPAAWDNVEVSGETPDEIAADGIYAGVDDALQGEVDATAHDSRHDSERVALGEAPSSLVEEISDAGTSSANEDQANGVTALSEQADTVQTNTVQTDTAQGDTVQTDTAQADAEPIASEPSEDLRALLRRLGQLPGDEVEEAPAPPAPAPVAMPVHQHAVSHGEHADEDDHDQAVQAYMARLLGKPVEPPRAAVHPHPSVAAPRPAPVEEAAPAPRQREYVRVAAPERQADISTLREVANLSAEVALSSFRRRKVMWHAIESIFLAIVALVGAYLFVAWLPFGPDYSLYTAGGCMIATVFFAMQAINHFRKLQAMNLATRPKASTGSTTAAAHAAAAAPVATTESAAPFFVPPPTLSK